MADLLDLVAGLNPQPSRRQKRQEALRSLAMVLQMLLEDDDNELETPTNQPEPQLPVRTHVSPSPG